MTAVSSMASVVSATGDIVLVVLQGYALSNTPTDPDDASVGYQLNTSGLERKYEGDGVAYSTIGTWLNSGAAGDYDCFMEDLGTGTDTPAGSAVDTWLNLGTTRAWTLDDDSPIGGAKTFNGTIKIATTGDHSTILASASVTMNVEVQN